VTSIEVARFVRAEPSSVALVLAGPAARELWPRRGDRTVAVMGGDVTTVSVDPPRRAGVGFVARVVVAEADTVIGTGRLTIRPAHGDDGGCDITLTLSGAADHERRLRRDVARYLDNVVRVSRERSSAA
jgi:hypothetical protein